MPDLAGQSFGRYTLREQLGEGGMASVYKAYDTRVETDVAVKVIRTENLPQSAIERALKRFEREAKSLARLTHPNIVKVMDYGEHEGKPYLVMPYLPGGTLKERMGKPMLWQEALRLLLPIAEALDYAHSQNIIHRDVKPANILLTQRGQPMLTDFGIAKILDLEETLELTGTSAAIGTPEYMAPEQATAKKVDHRADIYSLGIVLYEMVTGRKPFTADTPLAILFKHASDPLPSPRKFVPDLPDSVEKVLLKALAKKPEDRYQDMGEMAVAFEKLLSVGQASSLTTSAAAKPQEEKKAPKPRPANKMTDSPVTQSEISKPGERNNRVAGFSYMMIAGAVLAFVLLLFGVNYLMNNSTSATPIEISNSPIPSETGVVSTPTEMQIPPTPTDTLKPPTFTPAPEIGSFIESDGVTMMYVPAGTFSMGSETHDNEKPVHSIDLDAYYIDKFEVTNIAYKRCVDAGACTPPKKSTAMTRPIYYGNPEFDEYPIIYVDWNMAKAYCEWRDSRLPTEAEWEKAARSTDGRTYPWGEDISCDKSNYYGCKGYTTKVGSYLNGVSLYGLYDMAGNVWEWVNDWYSETYYQNSPSLNPLGPSSGKYRVLRGGSWFYGDDLVRSANRLRSTPDVINGDVGFRCARSFPIP